MRTFSTPKQALGWAAARRSPRLAQSKPDERVQAERSSPDDTWTASAIFSALARVGVDPHGAEADRVLAWATRSDHDVDDEGRSWSTHPADLAAAALGEEDVAQAEAARELAREDSAAVGRIVEALEVELAELGLLARRVEVVRSHRWYEVGADGRVRSVHRSSSPTETEAREQAELAPLLGLMIGPQLPARTLEGARLRFGRGHGHRTLRELDRAIAGWARCSERTARAARLRWGIRGRAGRRANSREAASARSRDSCCVH